MVIEILEETAVDDLPNGQVQGRCPVCRDIVTLNRHTLRAGILIVDTSSAAIGSVFRCARCDASLNDAGVMGRVLRGMLLVLALAGLASFAVLLGPFVPALFRDPVGAGAELWAESIGIFAVGSVSTFVVLRSLRRLMLSRYVLTNRQGSLGL